ncbi:thiamine phosphate synthase [Flavobacterium psychrotrophum]|uniref:thiamine phosphate synthase n=1 Tax=Flavobacterium psychrotrophum TaxID=2294119 RepID=UPI000E3205F1|nr:thiamine phosphate synthase [Flavobacterium psychrotrophum]
MQAFPYKLYLVVSEEACVDRDILWVTEEAIKGGVDIVQLREKHKTTAEFTSLAIKLKALLDKYNVPLIINDNIQVAMKVNAAGLHVGNSDMAPSHVKELWPECSLLGYSIEYIEQLSGIEVHYANHLGISPVFSTLTKTDTVTEWGLEGIAKICKLTHKPLVAIGNINANNAKAVINAGANCLAVVSAICGADDPRQAAMEIKNQIGIYDLKKI